MQEKPVYTTKRDDKLSKAAESLQKLQRLVCENECITPEEAKNRGYWEVEKIFNESDLRSRQTKTKILKKIKGIEQIKVKRRIGEKPVIWFKLP